uniref:DUF4629 domain-containing protein n=1 Tax=Myotis lucifugus TaxID=59463 RepID=G1Q6T0_MYOLU
QGPKVFKTKDTRGLKLHKVQKKSSVRKTRSDQGAKNKHKASEPIGDAPKAKIKPKSPDCVFVGGVVLCNAAASGTAPANMAKHSTSKPQRAAASQQDQQKLRAMGWKKKQRNKENYSKRAEERKQSGNKVKKSEEKLAIPKMKRKKSHPELPQEAIKKPRSGLHMHLLESTQVFHALGKRSGEKTEQSSSRALGNSSNPKGPQPRPVFKPWLGTRPCEGKGPVKTQIKPPKPHGSADKGSPPPSQGQLPSPGKVKLVPSVCPPTDKPPARPVPRRPPSRASRRPAVTNPAMPAAVNASLPAPVSVTGPGRSAQPMSTNSAGPGFDNPARPRVPRPPASRPGPYTTSSCASWKQEPVHSAVSQRPRAPPRPHNPSPLQHYTRQPIPWRTPEVPGQVMSTPITNEQRPEREAMKRKAQLEAEKAAKLGRSRQHFTEREEAMELARYYGCAM